MTQIPCTLKKGLKFNFTFTSKLRKKNEELKEMAEKKRFEEEVRQKRIEQEMEQELQRQAQLKLERKNEEEVVRFDLYYHSFLLYFYN